MKIKKQVTATIELKNEDIEMLKEIAEAARIHLTNVPNAYSVDHKHKLILFLDKIFDL
jgi:mannose/fructose/N-acetylgalactosamine-specific phosphotransferase system component IIB